MDSRNAEPGLTNGSTQSPVVHLVLLLLVGYVAPIALIYVNIIPFAARFWVLLATALALAVYARMAHYSARDLGFRTDTLMASLAANATLTAVVVGGLVLAYANNLVRAPTIPTWSLFFPLYVLVFCPAQEFSCRGVVFAALDRRPIFPASLQIGASAATYAFIHVIYRDPLLLAATFVIGIAWGAIYYWRPNIYGVMLSHAVLGVTSILVGLV